MDKYFHFTLYDGSNHFSYTLSREYQVVRNRYSRLLFTSEDHLCANLRLQRTVDEYDVTMAVAIWINFNSSIDIKNNAWVDVNNDSGVIREVICHKPPLVTSSYEKIIGKSLVTQKIVIHGNSCIILYIHTGIKVNPF